MSSTRQFSKLLAENRASVAPAVFNPLTARLAQDAGFEMLYLGGGTIGYLECCLEANLNITELAHAGIEIRAACDLLLAIERATVER